MLLIDVNVLLYAFREDLPDHEPMRAWLEGVARGDETFGFPGMVWTGFLRIVTNRRVFPIDPTPTGDALSYLEELFARPNYVATEPGPRHWGLLNRLCRDVPVRGDLVPDAYLAAIAIESGAELVTTDGDFARFPGLRWKHPLAP